MSDAITIYYAPDGDAWANYLNEKLCSDGYNIVTYLKDFETASSDIDTKVNVFVITPDFIHLSDWNLMSYFDPSSSLAVLTGVTFEEWSAKVSSSKIDALNDCCYHELLGEDLDGSVRELIVLIISIYEYIELGAVEPEEETYINIPADVKLPGKTTKNPPAKKQESKSSISDEVFEPSISKESNELEENTNRLEESGAKVNQEEDDIYKAPPPARPVNTVRYVFRQGDYVYVLLEDTNSGLVQAKFHEDGSVATAACVSDKTTVYAFQHKRTERETFDVTLDGIEIGYGTIEKDPEADRPPSTISEEFYDFPRPCRASVISTTSGSSSLSSRSSATGNSDQPPPCGNKTVGTRYINTPRSTSESSDKSDVRFSLSSSFPVIRDSLYESPRSWTGSDRDTLSESSTVKPSVTASPPGAASKLEEIRRLLEDVTDPVTVLCQCLKADNLKQLDEKMTSMLESTEVLKHLSFKTSLDALSDKCDTLCPTLLHFGAKFNLKIFCKFLLDSSITRNCAVKQNRNGDYPHNIARNEGHSDLARMIEDVALQLQSNKAALHDSGISLNPSTPAGSPMSPPTRDSLNLYMDMSGNRPAPQHTTTSPTAPQHTTTSPTAPQHTTTSPTAPQHTTTSPTAPQHTTTSPTAPQHTTTSPAKSILKMPSQGSLQSDDEDYEVPISNKVGAKAKPEFTVALGPSVYIADADDDNDKTPVPSGSHESQEQPFDQLIKHTAFSEGNLCQRESNGIENTFHSPAKRTSSEEFRTGRKDLKSIFGMEPPSSAPYEVPIQQPKKQGMFGKLMGKKDKARTLSNPKFTSEEMAVIHGKPHVGQKTHVFRRDLILSDPASEQFRSRLQTYPGPDQMLSRPNLKKLKTKIDRGHSSSTENLVASGAGHPVSPLALPPSPCSMTPAKTSDATNSPFQRHRQLHVKPAQQHGHGTSDTESRSPKEQEIFKKEKRKSDKRDKKEKNKKKVELMVTKAQKRASMRLHHARRDPVESAPALPPRPPQKQKPLGAF